MSADLLDKGLANSASRATLPGSKTDLTLAISIVGLALSSVSTLVSVLSFWQSTRPQYRVTIKRGDATYQVSNLDREQVREISESLTKAEATQTRPVVGVGHK